MNPIGMDYDSVFAEFVSENPHLNVFRKPVQFPDGRVETCVDLDTLEAFCRWCLRKKYGDQVKLVEMLSDYIPRMRMPNWGGLLKS